MRTFQLAGSAGMGALESVERPDPAPGDGEILIRMRAASLNYRDLILMYGKNGITSTPGIIPLSDGAGEVIAVGKQVSRFGVGDRVCPTFYQGWTAGDPNVAAMAKPLGGDIDGVLAELVVCNEQAAVKIPDHLSFEQAACLPCAGVTAWAGLYGPRPLLAGQTVLTLGTGGVSCFAIQFAKAAGALIVSTSSSDEKLEKARALGAHILINYAKTPDWHKEVLRSTGRRGVDHVVEIGGGGTVSRSIASTAIGGQIHLIGVLGTGEINPATLMASKTLRGIMVGSRAHFEAMNRLIGTAKIEPLIDRVFDFDAAPEAYRHLESASHAGKVVIRIA